MSKSIEEDVTCDMTNDAEQEGGGDVSGSHQQVHSTSVVGGLSAAVYEHAEVVTGDKEIVAVAHSVFSPQYANLENLQ